MQESRPLTRTVATTGTGPLKQGSCPRFCNGLCDSILVFIPHKDYPGVRFLEDIDVEGAARIAGQIALLDPGITLLIRAEAPLGIPLDLTLVQVHHPLLADVHPRLGVAVDFA